MDKMRMSEKKQTELYEAISEPIMQARIAINKFPEHTDIDQLMFNLSNEIWKEVQTVLNIDRYTY